MARCVRVLWRCGTTMVHTNDLLNGILKNKKELFLKTLQNAIEKVIEMHTRWSEKVKVQRRGRFFFQKSTKMAPPMTGMLPLRQHHNRGDMPREKTEQKWNDARQLGSSRTKERKTNTTRSTRTREGRRWRRSRTRKRTRGGCQPRRRRTRAV